MVRAFLFTVVAAAVVSVSPSHSVAQPEQDVLLSKAVRVAAVDRFIFVDHHGRRSPHVTFEVTNIGATPIFIFGTRYGEDMFGAVGETMEFDGAAKRWTYSEGRLTPVPFEQRSVESRTPEELPPAASIRFTRSWMSDEIGHRFISTFYVSATKAGRPIEIRTEPFELTKTMLVKRP